MRSKSIPVLTLIAALLSIAIWLPAAVPAQETQIVNADITVVRAYFADVADFYAIAAETDVWAVNHDEMYFETGATAVDIADLKAQGFRVEADIAHTAEIQRVESTAQAGIPGFPCYRTVEETFATAEALAAEHPNLVRWLDVGDSWEKINEGNGYDMQVLQITNFERDPVDKPKLFVTSAIHAREYTPAELNTRFAEMLVNGYGVDADITWILDYHDIHLMLQANPDGRKIAETGISKRKNMNDDHCGFSVNRGVDLNRNFPFEWGQHGGSSGSNCSLTYRGPSPNSEPETNAVVDYMRAIFPDQRDESLSAPAPDDATGIYMDIHSYSKLVLWPWGFPGVAPNGTALQTLGRKFAFYNGYLPTQSVNLYPTDGTTVDTGYGELGVAAFTFELGTSFFQSCSSFVNTILPDNMPALIYAAKVARAPYLLPAGPDVIDLATSQVNLLAGESFEVTATINDSRYNNQNGTEPTQNITAATLYFDKPSWEEGAVAQPMSAADGTFNSAQEEVALTITAPLVEGTYMLFVEGEDRNNVGATSAVFFNVVPREQPNSFVISTEDVTVPVAETFELPVSVSNLPMVVADTITVTVTFEDVVLLPEGCVAADPPFPTESCEFITSNTLQFVGQAPGEMAETHLFSIALMGSQPATTVLNLTAEILDVDGNFYSSVASSNIVEITGTRVLLPLMIRESFFR